MPRWVVGATIGRVIGGVMGYLGRCRVTADRRPLGGGFPGRAAGNRDCSDLKPEIEIRLLGGEGDDAALQGDDDRALTFDDQLRRPVEPSLVTVGAIGVHDRDGPGAVGVRQARRPAGEDEDVSDIGLAAALQTGVFKAADDSLRIFIVHVTEKPLSFQFELTPDRYPLTRKLSFNGEVNGHDVICLEATLSAQ